MASMRTPIARGHHARHVRRFRHRLVPGTQRGVDQRDPRATLNEALGSLTPSQYRTIVLAYFSGLSQSEIALRLDAPLESVKSWTRQGLLRLRETLEPVRV